MKIFLLIMYLFITGCILGWAIELLFRRFVSAKKWVNPGFMKGPWLPLYGFGVVVMFTICLLIVGFLPDSVKIYNPKGNLFGRTIISGPTWNDIIPIVLMWLGMNLLEFIAGIIFIKGFKVKLWDYSNMKGNIMGIVCPVFSIIWLSVAIVFYYAIDPFLYIISTNVYEYMFGENGNLAHFGFIFFMGVAYGLLLYDLVVSIGLFKGIVKLAKESGIIERYESLKKKWQDNIDNSRIKISIDTLKTKQEEASKVVKEKIANIIYIDPDLEKEKKDNYDKDGRPIKIK